jgi:hypothetical protein
MRIPAAAAAVTGALALSAFVLPAAHAEQASTAAAKPEITTVIVNGGEDIVVGKLTEPREIPITVIAKARPADLLVSVALWHGTDFDDVNGIDGSLFPTESAHCVAVNATTSTCDQTLTINPGFDLDRNELAGDWHVDAYVMDKNHHSVDKPNYADVKVLRAAKLTADTSKKQVKKGNEIGVSGNLTRADWDTVQNVGFEGAAAQLQFRAEGTRDFSTVKTVKASTDGFLYATVKASKDGNWRWSYAGNKATATATSPARFVNVV